jgi:stage V sporulation protein S
MYLSGACLPALEIDTKPGDWFQHHHPQRRGNPIMAEIIRVAAQSRTTAVAGAIAGILREEQVVIVQAMGAGAVNQAVKATVVARSYLEKDNLEVYMVPGFATVELASGIRTVTRLIVYTQHYQERNGQV